MQVAAPGGGAGYFLPMESREVIDALASAWREAGIEIIQEPTEMDFGYTVVGFDPDGHRLRPMAPASHTEAARVYRCRISGRRRTEAL